MGLLDSFMNLSPDQTQGLLAAAAQMLQQSGPSLKPTSLGQILGGGMQAYQGASAAAQKQRMDMLQEQQMQQMRDLQMQGLRGELSDKGIARQEALDTKKWYTDHNKARVGGQPMPAQGMGQATAAQQFLSQLGSQQTPAAQQSPAQGQPSQQSTDNIFQDRMSLAEAMRSSGIPALVMKADDVEKQALQFREEYSTTPQAMVGPDGKLGNYQLAKYGSPARNVGLGVKPDMVEMNLGGTTQWEDKNALTPGRIFQRTQTPDSKANNAVSWARLNWDKSQAEDGTGPLTKDAIDNAAARYNFDGTLPQMGMGKSAAAGRSEILNRAAELSGTNANQRADQLGNKGDATSRAAAVKAFSTGKQGNSVRSFNVAIDHLNSLDSLADALNNRDTQAVNKIGNFISTQLGQPAPTNFEAAKKIVADEVVKAIVGSGGALADREEAARVISATSSPAQLKGVIATYKQLMGGQLNGLEQQYRTSTGRDDFSKMLSPAARSAHGGNTVPNPVGGQVIDFGSLK